MLHLVATKTLPQFQRIYQTHSITFSWSYSEPNLNSPFFKKMTGENVNLKPLKSWLYGQKLPALQIF